MVSVVEDISSAVCCGEHYELRGEHVAGLLDTLKLIFAESNNGCPDPDFKLDYSMLKEYKAHPEHLQHFRDGAKAQAAAWKHPEVNCNLDQWYDKVVIEPLEEMGGVEYHPDAETTHGFKITVTEKPAVDRPCMVYFHGGACIGGTPEILEHVLVRYAVQCDMTVICSSYRVAPEAPVWLAGRDAYAATKWVLASASALGVDASRVTVWGESGGSKTATLCAMNFAEQNEGHMLKFFGAFASVTGNQYLKAEIDSPDCLHPHEKRMLKFQADIARCFAPDADAELTNPWVYPNLMSDHLCSKMPPAVIYTSEFDSARSSSEEAAEMYRRNGKLLAFGCLGGHNHVTWAAMDLQGSEAHFLSLERIVKQCL